MISPSLNLHRGFTLIELMVVIAIIGLLSSVIISSLVTARLKGRDSKLKQEVTQMRNLIELDYTEVSPSSFANLQTGTWYSSAAQCNAATFAGAYATKAKDICLAIVANSSSNFPGGYGMLYIGNSVSVSNNYSIMVFLPYKNTFYCVGNGGVNSDTNSAGAPWSQSGCYANP
jgi:prepilin-type N-terminal cleavage/methylation domain-containing protein